MSLEVKQEGHRNRELPRHLRSYLDNTVWRDITIGQAALNKANESPNQVAFIDDGTQHTFAEVFHEARALASSLMEMGISAGDNISFQLPNWYEAAVVNLAAALLGVVVTPIVPSYRESEVGHMLADSQSKVFFVAEQFRGFRYAPMIDSIRAALPHLEHVVVVRGPTGEMRFETLVDNGHIKPWRSVDVEPNSPKLLLYTSGTTGQPKGVVHSHNSLARVLQKLVEHWVVPGNAPILVPSPVTHITGYTMGLELPFLAGTRSVLMDIWKADVAVELVEKWGVFGTIAATPFLKELVGSARCSGTRLNSLRFFACGGASIPSALIHEANAVLTQAAVFRVYGCSEAPMISLGYPDRACSNLGATTDGQVVDYDVRIVNVNGNELALGEEGEILVRGPAMFLGYSDPTYTDAAITADGFFRTGDLGSMTAENSILVTGRIKDLIIRGGENISAREIEDVLHHHRAIREVAVVAMPHPRLGEGICAFIVLRDNMRPDVSDLATFVLEKGLARQKLPERYEFVDELPKTAAGKVRKDQLRNMVRRNVELELAAERHGPSHGVPK